MFKFFKKKPNKQYKLSEFAFRRIHNDQVQVYHKGNNKWMAWYEIVGDVFDASDELVSEMDLHHALIDRTRIGTLDNTRAALKRTPYKSPDASCYNGFESFVADHVSDSSSSVSAECDGDASHSSSNSADSSSFD
ncbi:hypothetical protein [Pseudoalteromonas byunsanensis]|uniref:Uncharacterized protein n=1 Tax=Pseudoalteromonas byunsanensis TaxID=327939 RepID=A0A1S1NA45_9GAMM|nr:hypothetical protein [Pseudoalteromonas byunsanensis]OHU96548.1 hypothetical protein BIW53_04260 [Pseudoalteromonas byunsanensis]